MSASRENMFVDEFVNREGRMFGVPILLRLCAKKVDQIDLCVVCPFAQSVQKSVVLAHAHAQIPTSVRSFCL